MVANVNDTTRWNELLDWKLFGKPMPGASSSEPPTRRHWDTLLGKYGAITDLPGVIFVDELLDTYPNAKVVLVERDIERWYISFSSGIINNVWNPVSRLISRVDPYFVGPLASVAERWTKGWFKANSKEEMEHNAREVYRKHYEHVRRVTPKNRLLEFDLKDGWEPLCEFLGKDTPDVPFPNTNDSAALQTKINGYMRTGLLNAAGRLLPIIGVFIAVTVGTKVYIM